MSGCWSVLIRWQLQPRIYAGFPDAGSFQYAYSPTAHYKDIQTSEKTGSLYVSRQQGTNMASISIHLRFPQLSLLVQVTQNLCTTLRF